MPWPFSARRYYDDDDDFGWRAEEPQLQFDPQAADAVGQMVRPAAWAVLPLAFLLLTPLAGFSVLLVALLLTGLGLVVHMVASGRGERAMVWARRLRRGSIAAVAGAFLLLPLSLPGAEGAPDVTATAWTPAPMHQATLTVIARIGSSDEAWQSMTGTNVDGVRILGAGAPGWWEVSYGGAMACVKPAAPVRVEQQCPSAYDTRATQP